VKNKKFAKYLPIILLIIIGTVFFSNTKLKANVKEESPYELLEKSHQEIVLTAKKDFSNIMDFESEKVKYVGSSDEGMIFLVNSEQYFAKINQEEIEYPGIKEIYLNYKIVYSEL
jgi:hypothetical protein